MTTLFATPSRSATPGAAWRYGWASVLADLYGRLADWNDARLTRRMLRGLSVFQLDDIGLCRGDIDAVAARGGR